MRTKIINKCISATVFCLALISPIMLSATSLPSPNDKTATALKPKLNSERIEHFFGNYGVETINACGDIFPDSRISNLYSTHDKQKIMRTFAVVDYVSPIPELLRTVHDQKILSGESIGRALKEAGWEILKTPIYFGEISLSAPVMKWMHEAKRSKGTAYIYQLSVYNKEHPNYISYCTISEIYSPQYLTKEWMKALYGDEEYFEHDDEDLFVKMTLQKVENCLNKLPTPN
jgi:hypothetical protein